MKWSTAALSVATLSLAMLTPAFGQTHDQATPDNPSPGLQEAQQMVPARTSLLHALDANDMKPGAQFRVMLKDNVHLNNGVELRHGDNLLGTVVTDDTNTPGRSRLAVRFDKAVLKNGQTIPVKATIVAIYSPGALEGENSFNGPVQVPNNWTSQTLTVDQINALHDIDLHSRIASPNSGVFVSTKNNDVKIPSGSELALAIAARDNTPTNPANSGS